MDKSVMLYNKYRPQDYNSVVGQESVLISLRKQSAKKKHRQAYLFTGVRGTGKTSIARIAAKAINCLNSSDAGPCNKCEHCNSIDNKEAMDFIEVDGATNNGVNEISEIISQTNYFPIKFKYKVFLIDEVHNLSTSAFDTLLKTLEEPPSYCIFFMCTTEKHKIPATIQSRCEPYEFRAISEDKIVERLEYVLQDTNVKYDKNALYLVAKKAQGGLRDALSITDKLISSMDTSISNALVKQVLSLIDDEITFEIIFSIIRKNPVDACEKLKTVMNEGKSLHVLIEDILATLSDLAVFITTKNKKSLHNSDKYIDNIENISKYTGAEEIFWLVNEFSDLRTIIKSNVNPFLEVQLVILKTSNLDLVRNDPSHIQVEVAAQSKKIAELEERLNSITLNGIVKIPAVADTLSSDIIDNPGETEDTISKLEQPKDNFEGADKWEKAPKDTGNLFEEEQERGGEGPVKKIDVTPEEPFPDLFELF